MAVVEPAEGYHMCLGMYGWKHLIFFSKMFQTTVEANYTKMCEQQNCFFLFFFPIVQCTRRVLLPCAQHYIFLAVGGKDRERGKAIYKSRLSALLQSIFSFTADKFLSSSVIIVVRGFTLYWLWSWWSGVLSLWSYFNELIWLSLYNIYIRITIIHSRSLCLCLSHTHWHTPNMSQPLM